MKNTPTLAKSALLAFALAVIPLSSVHAALSLAIQSVSPSTTIAVNQTITFIVVASGFSSPTFRATDSFRNTTTATIDSSGNFRWTPDSNDIGTHTFTITVTDSLGNVVTAQQQVIVSTSSSSNNSLTIQSLFPSSSVTTGQQVLFTAVASGFTNPTYTVSDSFGGSTVRSNFINSSGNFNWTPQVQDTGTHVITVSVTDSSGRSASAQTTITVSSNQPNNTSSAIQGPFPSSTVQVGTQATFSVTSIGFINPIHSVSSSRSSSITNSNINSSGFFSWIPNINDVGTHVITVNTSDAFGHFRTLQTTINVFSSTSNTISQPSQTTIEILQAQIASLQAQIATFLGTNSGSFSSSEFITGLPSSTATVVGTGNGRIFTNFMQVGSTGDEVVELQRRLTSLGVYSGPVTGFFGSLTQAGLRRFQAQHGISQTGSADSATLQALNQSSF